MSALSVSYEMISNRTDGSVNVEHSCWPINLILICISFYHERNQWRAREKWSEIRLFFHAGDPVYDQSIDPAIEYLRRQPIHEFATITGVWHVQHIRTFTRGTIHRNVFRSKCSDERLHSLRGSVPNAKQTLQGSPMVAAVENAW